MSEKDHWYTPGSLQGIIHKMSEIKGPPHPYSKYQILSLAFKAPSPQLCHTFVQVFTSTWTSLPSIENSYSSIKTHIKQALPWRSADLENGESLNLAPLL